jgi:heme oxygenase
MERLSRALIQLNIATREQHGAADAPWLDLMVPTVDRHDYVKHLVKVYGFEAALESAFHYTPGLTALLDLRSRNRSGFIVQDLMRLGMGAARIAELAQRFVTFSSAAEALGWMYVADRSTLLHGAVRRYLALRIPEVAGASSYLSCCDGIAATRWNDLGAALDAVTQLPWGKRQVIRAARQGFAAHSEWFHGRAVALQSIGA